MKKIDCLIFLSFVFLFINIGFVSSFGVATLYSENYPLKLLPGEGKETFFLLRNVAEGDDDVLIRAKLINDLGVATLVDENLDYKVLAGESVEVPVLIRIPEDAEMGKQYRVEAVFSPLSVGSGDAGGNVQFLVTLGKSFIVVVEGYTGEIEKLSGPQLSLDDNLYEADVGFAPFKAENIKTTFWIVIIFAMFVLIAFVIVLIFYVIKKNNNSGQLINSNFVRSQYMQPGFIQEQ